MSLNEIKKELYRKESNPEMLQHEKSEFNTESVVFSSSEKAVPSVEDDWAEKEASLVSKNKKMIKLGALVLGALLLIIALVVGFYKIRQSFFAFERLAVTLSGPTELKSGNLSVYEITYKNANRADLKNVSLKLSYPEDFRPEANADFKPEGTTSGVFSLGDIKGNSEGSVAFSGRAYSPKGNLIKIKAELTYTPSTVSSVFVTSNQLAVSILSAPITLEVMAPQNISSGDEVNYLITYKNDGAENFENIRVRINYPERFVFSSSDPKFSEGNNIWYLGNLSAGQSGRIVVAGKLEGDRDETKIASIMIGANDNGDFVSYNETEVKTRIVSSPLTINQTVNGLGKLNANAGDSLKFEINYKNEGTLGLRDVIVTEHIDSPILDYSTLDMEGGAYDAGSKTITWKAPDYRELKNLLPGQGGVIKFSIRVKEIIPVASVNDKNFVISSLAKIDSPDVPTPISMNKIISGNKMDIKLNSKLILDVKGYYSDVNIPNSGPIPPKVGEETTYTMHYIVKSVSSDISDAKVETSLPTSVVMTGKIFPEGTPLSYNERTNSIVWNIGNLTAGTGILSIGKEVSFQVKIKPSADQAGDVTPLLKESVFSARDLFTGESVSARVSNKSTYLLEDSSLGVNFKVVN
jgi:hypothetical protein